MRKVMTGFLVLCVALAWCPACGKDQTDPAVILDSTNHDNDKTIVEPEDKQLSLMNIFLRPENAQVIKGETLQLKVIGVYENGTTEEVNIEAGWESSDASVAEVDLAGVVLGRKIGTADITATYLHLKATVPVQVVGK